MFAAEYGHLDVIEVLVERGADLETKDQVKSRGGRTACHMCSYDGDNNLISGHNLLADCALWLYVFYVFMSVTNVSVFYFFCCFLVCQNGESALMYAATNGHLSCLTYLADKGANIETKNYVSRELSRRNICFIVPLKMLFSRYITL
jgi:ankyrin repeat protein